MITGWIKFLTVAEPSPQEGREPPSQTCVGEQADGDDHCRSICEPLAQIEEQESE